MMMMANQEEWSLLSESPRKSSNSDNKSGSLNIMRKTVKENLINFMQGILSQDATHRIADKQPANTS